MKMINFDLEHRVYALESKIFIPINFPARLYSIKCIDIAGRYPSNEIFTFAIKKSQLAPYI